jgi:hypothetical protein
MLGHKALLLSAAMAGAFMVAPGVAAADDAAPHGERVRVQFRAEDPGQKHVVVSLDTGGRCLTPCTLMLYPGTARIAVRGPYDFETEIEVQPHGGRFVVRVGSVRNSLLSILLVVAGVGSAVTGMALASAEYCPNVGDLGCGWRGRVAVLGGVLSTAGGIVWLVRSARQSVYPYQGASSDVRWSQLSIPPTNQGVSFVGVWRF